MVGTPMAGTGVAQTSKTGTGTSEGVTLSVEAGGEDAGEEGPGEGLIEPETHETRIDPKTKTDSRNGRIIHVEEINLILKSRKMDHQDQQTAGGHQKAKVKWTTRHHDSKTKSMLHCFQQSLLSVLLKLTN